MKKDELPQPEESRTGVGFLLGFFLGLIGLVICVAIYKEGSLERRTGIKGCVGGWITSMALALLICGIAYIEIIDMFNSLI